MKSSIFILSICSILVFTLATLYLIFSEVDTRLDTEQQILPWWSVILIPTAATVIAAMEIEIEGGFGWSAMIPTKRLIGGFTAYHLCLGLSVIVLVHFAWIFAKPNSNAEAFQVERGLIVCVISLFLFEDLAWQLMNPAPSCSNTLCIRNLKSGAFKKLDPYLMYAILFSLAALVGVDPMIYPLLVSMLVLVLIYSVLFPGYLIRNSYKERRHNASLMKKDKLFMGLSGSVNKISDKYGINGLRKVLHILQPSEDLYTTGANISLDKKQVTFK